MLKYYIYPLFLLQNKKSLIHEKYITAKIEKLCNPQN